MIRQGLIFGYPGAKQFVGKSDLPLEVENIDDDILAIIFQGHRRITLNVVYKVSPLLEYRVMGEPLLQNYRFIFRAARHHPLMGRIDLSAADTRYVSPPDHEEVRDTHRGGPAAPVNLMEYVLRALVEKELESAPEFQVFPVAELVYDGNELKPTRSFVPPLVTIAASD